MFFPLDFWDVSLWLAVTAVILLIGIGIILPYYGESRILVSKRKLRNVSLAVSILFLATIVTRIVSLI